jgi:hypothetical protein
LLLNIFKANRVLEMSLALLGETKSVMCHVEYLCNDLASKCRVGSADALTLAAGLVSLAHLSADISPALADRIAATLEPQISSLPFNHVVQLVWAFGCTGQCPPRLLPGIHVRATYISVARAFFEFMAAPT